MKKEFTEHQVKMLNTLLKNFEYAYWDTYKRYDELKDIIRTATAERDKINDNMVEIVEYICKGTNFTITKSVIKTHDYS